MLTELFFAYAILCEKKSGIGHRREILEKKLMDGLQGQLKKSGVKTNDYGHRNSDNNKDPAFGKHIV
jgi:hypothetical protein